MVERDGELSMVKQCELLTLSRSGLYYEPRPVSELNLLLMRMIDEQYARPLLWRAANDDLALKPGISGEPQESAPADARDGAGDDLYQALGEWQPEVFNSDQGTQFTSQDFTERLLKRGIAIRMDGRGRALDNIFADRLWRSVKYEGYI